jgi:hypothetical protein
MKKKSVIFCLCLLFCLLAFPFNSVFAYWGEGSCRERIDVYTHIDYSWTGMDTFGDEVADAFIYSTRGVMIDEHYTIGIGEVPCNK